MHRQSLLWLLCVATASGCVVATKKQEPTVREYRTERREPPPRRPAPPPRPTPRPTPPPPQQSEWEARGWVLLGEQAVRGQVDRDVIRVSRRDGAFSKLLLVVEDSDLKLNDIIITYDNGRKHSPRVRHQFREGSRSAPIDIKGESRVISQVELRYSNVPGGRATVQLWGKPDATAGGPAPTPPPGPGWDSRGWNLMSERWVRGGKHKEVFRIMGSQGAYTRLMLVVDEGDLDLNQIIVEYDNGRKHSPKLRHSFRDGSRTRPIDLKGDARTIRSVEVRYGNLRQGERAKVQIWGREG
jgi:hypothetical protein